MLVGAGHAHVRLALQAARFRARDARLILMDPGCFECMHSPRALGSGWPWSAVVPPSRSGRQAGRAGAAAASRRAADPRHQCAATFSDLPADPTDGVRVAPTLQSIDDTKVFAVGDCMSFVEQPLRKLGVYGVRAAPIPLHNLLASLEGRPLRRYRPQKRYLSILNPGDGTALAVWGPLWWQGRLSHLLKHRTDPRFLNRYRQVVPTAR